MADEDSWAVTGLKTLGEHWIETDFAEGCALLRNALRFDLAYSRSERLPEEQATAIYQAIIQDYVDEPRFLYSNYHGNPWQDGSYSGWSLTDDWTFDLAIVLLNPQKLTFCYFLSED